MSADLLGATLALVAAIIWATRGDGRALRDYIDQRAATRHPHRPTEPPRVSAPGRVVSPFADPPGPRALDWIDGELLPDPTPRQPARHALPELSQLPELVIQAREADPLPARARGALPRRPRPSAPGRRAIEPPRRPGPDRPDKEQGKDPDRGAVTVRALLVVAAGVAVAAILAAHLLGAA